MQETSRLPLACLARAQKEASHLPPGSFWESPSVSWPSAFSLPCFSNGAGKKELPLPITAGLGAPSLSGQSLKHSLIISWLMGKGTPAAVLDAPSPALQIARIPWASLLPIKRAVAKQAVQFLQPLMAWIIAARPILKKTVGMLHIAHLLTENFL